MINKRLPQLSVVIHTRNEAINIAECIASIKGLASEVVVADMHSTDETVKIARKLGAKVINVPTAKGYADLKRDFAISKAKGEWILVLDADERVSPSLKKKIQQLLRQDLYDVVKLPRKNIMLGKWIKHSLRWPDYQTRLFKQGSVTWPAEVHPVVECHGTVHELPATAANALVHFHTKTIDQLLEKTKVQAAQERFYDAQKKVDILMANHRIMNEFPWRQYEHHGFKDGMHGFITNKFMEFYRFLEFAYYWERSGKKELFTAEQMNAVWNREQRIKELETELHILKSSKIYILWEKYRQFKRKLSGKS